MDSGAQIHPNMKPSKSIRLSHGNATMGRRLYKAGYKKLQESGHLWGHLPTNITATTRKSLAIGLLLRASWLAGWHSGLAGWPPGCWGWGGVARTG